MESLINADTEQNFSFDNKSKLEELNDEYNQAVQENSGYISKEAIDDIYKKKKEKLSFDELAKIIADGGN